MMTNAELSPSPADARRWNAYVCQDCRGIFRVPVGHAGKGVVCPICDRMLRLPVDGEVIPALVQGAEAEAKKEITQTQNTAEIVEPEDETQEEFTGHEQPESSHASVGNLAMPVKRKRKHRKYQQEDAEQEWRQETKQSRSSGRGNRSLWFALAAGMMLSAILFLSYLWLNRNKVVDPALAMPTAAVELSNVAEPVVNDTASKSVQFDIVKITHAVREYFEAQTPAQLVNLVRKTQGVENKIAQYYEKQEFKPVGFSSLDENSLQFSEDLSSVAAQVVTKDYDHVPVVIHVAADQSYLVDWEATVGWCEMNSVELIKNKPQQPVTVRVVLQAESYYNFDYPPSEERLWQSYRLVFSDETMLHGYVAKVSDLDNALRLSPDETQKAVTLQIKYRADSSNGKQVEIEKIIRDGWCEP